MRVRLSRRRARGACTRPMSHGPIRRDRLDSRPNTAEETTRRTLMDRRSFLATAGLRALAAGLSTPAAAQAPAWPQRNVRFIVPLGPGSGVDIGARLLAERLAVTWGKPVVVENK